MKYKLATEKARRKQLTTKTTKKEMLKIDILVFILDTTRYSIAFYNIKAKYS